MQLFLYLLGTLAAGAVLTLVITLGGLVVAVLLGLIFAVLKLLPWRLPKILAGIYVEVFRGVPVLTQLFLIYFGLAEIGIALPSLAAAVIGFGLNGGAYLTEVFRAGFQSVDRGQLEAAHAIGLTFPQRVRYVALPQAMRLVLPALGNYAVGLLKDTALASAVAAPELTFRARILVNETFLSAEIYLLTAAIYLALSLPLARLASRLEAHSHRGRAVSDAVRS